MLEVETLRSYLHSMLSHLSDYYLFSGHNQMEPSCTREQSNEESSRYWSINNNYILCTLRPCWLCSLRKRCTREFPYWLRLL